MGDKSKIEWTDATWNPVTGCTKVSAGCKFCYAERDFHRPYPGRAFNDVRTHPDRLDQPLRWKKPRKIFVNSMSDLFHEDVSDHFLDQCFAVTSIAARHTFQILTKRPERMLDYIGSPGRRSEIIDAMQTVAFDEWTLKGRSGRLPDCAELGADTPDPNEPLVRIKPPDWPLPNVWLGVSVEDQATADERIPLLLKTPAAVRFVSYEPALGPVDFSGYLPIRCCSGQDCGCMGKPITPPPWLNWIISGGESGPQARPSHPDWFRSVRNQCQAAGVPFFFKQWGEWAHWVDAVGSVCGLPKARVTRNQETEQGVIEWADMIRLGKKRAGRLLDGKEHNEFPA